MSLTRPRIPCTLDAGPALAPLREGGLRSARGNRTRFSAMLGWAGLVATLLPAAASAQAAEPGADSVIEAPAPGDVLGEAKAAQARFELRRVRHFPRVRDGSHGPCDETVGRFCTWYDEGEWTPEPEPPEVASMRTGLLSTLDSLQAHAPGDGWVLGQRVWYRYEAGDLAGALGAANSCGPPQEDWWCSALLGFALHVNGRYEEAERAFEHALYRMDLERAWSWRVPVRVVDPELRDVLEPLREAPPDSVERVLERMWRLADPLLLVPGNDRKTEHFARWTVAAIREGARNPYRLSWGSDLEELLVRHGWELGWERDPDPRFLGPDGVVGHKHPEGRDYMPPGVVLTRANVTTPDDLVAGHVRPSSLYAPPYAPVVLPFEGQVARFPRGRSVIVVATHDLPEDTTRHATHDHPRPWMEPREQQDMPDRAGLFLVDLDRGEVRARTVEGGTRGVLMVEGGSGTHMLSVEFWRPRARLAGRHRAIVEHRATPADIPVLSDLLLLEAGEDRPEGLEAAVPRALPALAVEEGMPFALAWEVTGLGFRPETLAYELSVERVGRSLLERVGSFLGLGGGPRSQVLSWEEEGPYEPGPAFQHLEVELPDLEPGTYRVRLVLRTATRDPVETSLEIDIR